MQTLRRVALLFFTTLLSGCTQLGLYDALAPYDRGAKLVARSVAYGPEPGQRLDVFAPAAGEGPFPVAVFVHGGSWASGSRSEYGFVGAALAARGFVAVLIDYRLVPAVRYPDFVQDTAKAFAWTVSEIGRYGGDPGRVALVGHSAGAYNAMMVALAPEFLDREGVPMSRVRGVAGLSGPYDFLPFDVDASREAFKGAPDLPATQPVNRVGSAGPPVFLATGDADTTVRPRNTANLARRLEAVGRPPEVHVYPGVSHAGTLLSISRPLRGRTPVLDDLTTFLRKVTANPG